MSTLTENVAKVKNAHAALKTAIEGKGVTVPAGTKLTGMPALVDQIQTGGGGEGGYLTFTAVEASTLTLKQNGNIEPQKLLKSTDAQNWTKWENPQSNAISLQAGESVYIKADEDASTRTATDSSNYNYFYMTGVIACTGDVVPLVKLAAPANYQRCFEYLFKNCASLTKAPVLPATTLTDYCYEYMFYSCQSLVKAPALPATTLAQSCYSSMFYSCQSLREAPALPATTLTDCYNCYSGMFYDCRSLAKAPELPATALARGCYQSMFLNCSSLTAAPALPATTIVDQCYYEMFKGCSSLTAAPALPATTFKYGCYYGMFNNCTSLEQAPYLPGEAMYSECYTEMFKNCLSLKRIKMNASSGSWGLSMFNGCTSLELVDMTGSTGVPTLSYIDNFQNTNDTYKVVVPDSLYDTWIAATNWASIASHIMKQSDWNAAHPDDQL